MNSRPLDNESNELPDCSTLPLFARLKGLQPFRDSPSKSILHLRLSDDILRNCYERLDTLCRHQRIGYHSNLAIRFFSPTNIDVSCRTSTFALKLKNRRGIQLLAARTIPVLYSRWCSIGFHREIRTPIPCFRDKCPQPVRRCGIKLNEQRESRSPRLCTWFYYLLTADNK